MSSSRRIFLLSPADCTGQRARCLLREDASSPLARHLRSPDGAPIGDVFAFLSSLYFRGKLAYASAFAAPSDERIGVQVIVPGLGLRSADTRIDLGGLRAVAGVPVNLDEDRYVGPLRRDAALLAEDLGPGDVTVLLGSIATPKYIVPLLDVLGERLRIPEEFVGLGSLSRGSLLLRRVVEGRQLTYVAASEPTRPGP